MFRNCIIQSSFKYTTHGSVIFDSCGINVTDIGQGHFKVQDSSTADVRRYLKGATNVASLNPNQTVLQFEEFVNPYSQVIYEAEEVGRPVVNPNPIPSTSPPADEINGTRGAVEIEPGYAYAVVYNNLITTDSLVFAQLRTYAQNGAQIREVACAAGYFAINLTAAAANTLSVAFKVER